MYTPNVSQQCKNNKHKIFCYVTTIKPENISQTVTKCPDKLAYVNKEKL